MIQEDAVESNCTSKLFYVFQNSLQCVALIHCKDGANTLPARRASEIWDSKYDDKIPEWADFTKQRISTTILMLVKNATAKTHVTHGINGGCCIYISCAMSSDLTKLASACGHSTCTATDHAYL
jgi:hypothetical protein